MSTRIARIETFLFRAEVNEPVKTSFGSIPRRSALLVRVEDRDGAHGWGEVWCNFPPYSADNKMRLFETVIAPAALATEYSCPSDAWHSLTARISRWASQGGEPGPFAACIAGIDLALWDMAARRAGKPLRTLLAGDDAHDRMPAYASGLNPDTALETVGRCREAGFTAFKVKVAFGTETDTQVVSTLARDLRDGERLMVDANQGWDLAEARRAVPRLGAFGLGFIEEPIPADRPVHEWAELALLSPVPLAGGENVMGFRRIRHFDPGWQSRGRPARHAQMGWRDRSLRGRTPRSGRRAVLLPALAWVRYRPDRCGSGARGGRRTRQAGT